MKELVFNIIHSVLAALIIMMVLLQQKGSGLGQAFGGSSNIYSTRRGIDKTLHYATVVVGALFFVFSVVRLIV